MKTELEILAAEIFKEAEKDNEPISMQEAEEMAKMELKDKKNRRYEKSDKPRKKSSKERKVDNEKKKLLEYLERGLYDNIVTGGYTITEVKNESEFSFLHNGTAYTVKLIKHRPKK